LLQDLEMLLVRHRVRLLSGIPASDNGHCTTSLRDSSWLAALVRGCAGVPRWTGGGT
jgi:hypothetical protein